MSRTHDPTHQPTLHAPAASPTERRSEILYYDKQGVRVTDCWFVVAGRRYLVSELGAAHTLRGTRTPAARNAALAAVAVAVLITVTARYLDTAGWIGAAIVLLVPVVVFAGGMLRQRPYEMWAGYRGMTVRLLADDDPQRYNQICRALVRARERT